MRVFAAYNIKGGVGKTTTAVNLAYLSARAGARTLIWDLDPQGAASFYFRIKPRVRGGARKLLRDSARMETAIRATDYEGLDLLPADFSYRGFDLELHDAKRPKSKLADLLRPLSRSYDHVYLDCAPSISLTSEAIFHVSDTLLVPTIPTTLSLRTLDQLFKHLGRSRTRVEVLPFFCMVDRRKSMHRRICAKRTGRGAKFLATEIPYSSLAEQMGSHRAPLGEFAAEGDPTVAYRDLWHEVLARRGSWLGWVRRATSGYDGRGGRTVHPRRDP